MLKKKYRNTSICIHVKIFNSNAKQRVLNFCIDTSVQVCSSNCQNNSINSHIFWKRGLILSLKNNDEKLFKLCTEF